MPTKPWDFELPGILERVVGKSSLVYAQKVSRLSGMGPAVFGGSIAEDCRHFQNRSGLSLQTFVLLQSDVEHLAHQQGEEALAKDLNTITCHFASLGGIKV